MKISKIIREILFHYSKVYKITKVSKQKILLILFLTVITVALDALGIGILIPIGEYVLNYDTGMVPDTNSWKMLNRICLFLSIEPSINLLIGTTIIIVLFRQIITYKKAMMTEDIRYYVVFKIRKLLFNKFLERDFYYIKQHSTGGYNNLINLEAVNIGKASIFPVEVISAIIVIVAYTILMCLISYKATLILFGIVFISGPILKKIFYLIKETAKKIISINDNFSQNLVDRLLAMKFVRLNNAISKEDKNNESILKNQFINNMKLAKIQAISNTAIEPALFIATIPIIVISLKGGFPLAKLGVFVLLLARFMPIFKRLIVELEVFTISFASVKNMIFLIDKIDNQREIRKGSLLAPTKISKIEFKNVNFQYSDNDEFALNNFSCVIKGGLINVIVGVSGKGKSTIINMIPRLLEPQSGIIEINSISLKKISSQSIRNMCSYIDQKPVFIRGTIEDHLSYNNPGISRTECIEAAKLTKAHDFILKLPNNYEYNLGESGVGLSGGQLQRLDITRGIVSNKPLIILDEPTNNLDNENKQEIFSTLRKIINKKNITILIVSHDRDIIKFCDNIIKV